jgi:VanZ family protein
MATVFYVLLLIVALLVPINGPHGSQGSYLRDESTATDFILNIVVLAPVGWGLGRCDRFSRLSPGAMLIAVGLIVSMFSLTMETMQYLFVPNRYSSLADIMANTVGGVLGAWSLRWRDAVVSMRREPPASVDDVKRRSPGAR